MTSFRPPTAGFAGRGHFHFPAARFGEARVHAEDFGREQGGLIAARAGADFEDHVLLVVGILGQQQDLQLFFDLRQLRLQSRDFFLGHGAQVGVGFLQHGARFLKIVVSRFPLAILADGLGQIAVRLGDFAILRGVVDDGGVGHLRRQLVEAALDLVESLSDIAWDLLRA